MRFPRFLYVLAAVLFLPALGARADTITTFDFTGTLATVPYTASGTVTIDTTSGAVHAIDLSFPGSIDAGVGETSSGLDVNSAYIEETWLGVPVGDGYSTIAIFLPLDTLVGYTGGDICSLDNPCAHGPSIFGQGISNFDFTNGTLFPTPEPSSLTLVGLGALAILGMLRGRHLRA